jgi:hypothetical protein
VKVNAIGFESTAIKPEEISKALEATAREISRLAKSSVEKRSAEFESLKAETNRMLARMKKALEGENIEIKLDVQRNEVTVKPTPQPRDRETSKAIDTGNGDALTPYQVDILRGLAELEAIGRADVPFALAGAAAGRSATSSTFERYRSRLQSAGLVAYPRPGHLALTDEGRKVAPAPEHSLSSDEIQKRCLSLLTPYQAALAEALISVHPNAVTRDMLGDLSGKQSSSSTFERYVASLRTMEIIEYAGAKMLKAADWLFLE